jgi:hypothetical protein
VTDEYDDEGDGGPEPDEGSEPAASSVNPHPGHCRVCDIPVVPKTRQYCDEHKSLAGKGAKRKLRAVRALPGPNTGLKDRALTEAGAILDDLQYNTIAMLAPVAPITASTWALKAEANTRATLTIARSHPKVLDGILKAAEAEAYIALATFGISIIVAAGVEVGMIAADGRMAGGLGITEIVEQVDAELGRTMARVADSYDVADTPGPSAPGGLAAEL